MTAPRARAVGRITAAVYTSPHATPDLDPEAALLALLRSARRSIRFAAYSFTLPDLAGAIADAHRRGLDVRGVGDAGAATWRGRTSQWPALAAAGVDVRKWGGNYRLMHDKVAVVDGRSVALGSWNWTTQAERANVEVLLIATGAAAGRVLAPLLTAQVEAAYAAGDTP